MLIEVNIKLVELIKMSKHYSSIGTTARLSVRSGDHRAMVRSSQNIYLFFYANFNIVFLTKHVLEKNIN